MKESDSLFLIIIISLLLYLFLFLYTGMDKRIEKIELKVINMKIQVDKLDLKRTENKF